MFYAVGLLSSKKKFSLPWMACTHPKKFKTMKRACLLVNLDDLCTAIIEKIPSKMEHNRNKFSLYLCSQLMYGTVRVHQVRVVDCLTEAEKMRWSSSKQPQMLVNLNLEPLDVRTITDRDAATMFDLTTVQLTGVNNGIPGSMLFTLPDMSSMEEFDSQLQQQQGRHQAPHERITINEEIFQPREGRPPFEELPPFDENADAMLRAFSRMDDVDLADPMMSRAAAAVDVEAALRDVALQQDGSQFDLEQQRGAVDGQLPVEEQQLLLDDERLQMQEQAGDALLPPGHERQPSHQEQPAQDAIANAEQPEPEIVRKDSPFELDQMEEVPQAAANQRRRRAPAAVDRAQQVRRRRRLTAIDDDMALDYATLKRWAVEANQMCGQWNESMFAEPEVPDITSSMAIRPIPHNANLDIEFQRPMSNVGLRLRSLFNQYLVTPTPVVRTAEQLNQFWNQAPEDAQALSQPNDQVVDEAGRVDATVGMAEEAPMPAELGANGLQDDQQLWQTLEDVPAPGQDVMPPVLDPNVDVMDGTIPSRPSKNGRSKRRRDTDVVDANEDNENVQPKPAKRGRKTSRLARGGDETDDSVQLGRDAAANSTSASAAPRLSELPSGMVALPEEQTSDVMNSAADGADRSRNILQPINEPLSPEELVQTGEQLLIHDEQQVDARFTELAPRVADGVRIKNVYDEMKSRPDALTGFTFYDICRPAARNRIQAAKIFNLCLVLAKKRAIEVNQDDSEPFGDIIIKMIDA